MAIQSGNVKVRTSGGSHLDPVWIWIMLREMQLTDFTVRFPNETSGGGGVNVCGMRGAGVGKVIQCHKIVLAAYSDLFRGTFSTSFPGSDLDASVLKIKSEDFQNLLHFLYHGEVDIARAEFLGLRETAVNLRVRTLLEELERMLLVDPSLAIPPVNLKDIKLEEEEDGLYIVKEIDRKSKRVIREVTPEPVVTPPPQNPPTSRHPMNPDPSLMSSGIGNSTIQLRATGGALEGNGGPGLEQPQHVFVRRQEEGYYGLPLGAAGGNREQGLVTFNGGHLQPPPPTPFGRPFPFPFGSHPSPPVGMQFPLGVSQMSVLFRGSSIPAFGQPPFCQLEQAPILMTPATQSFAFCHNDNYLPPPPQRTVTPVQPKAVRKHYDEKGMERFVNLIIAQQASRCGAARELGVNRKTIAKKVASLKRKLEEELRAIVPIPNGNHFEGLAGRMFSSLTATSAPDVSRVNYKLLGGAD